MESCYDGMEKRKHVTDKEGGVSVFFCCCENTGWPHLKVRPMLDFFVSTVGEKENDVQCMTQLNAFH